MTPYISPDGTLHELYRVLFILGKSYSGEVTFDPGDHPELGYRRQGLAFFCPTCGEIWARFVFVQSSGVPTSFQVQVTACAAHPDQWQVPGSLIPFGQEAWVEILPKPLLAREVDVHLKWRQTWTCN